MKRKLKVSLVLIALLIASALVWMSKDSLFTSADKERIFDEPVESNQNSTLQTDRSNANIVFDSLGNSTTIDHKNNSLGLLNASTSPNNNTKFSDISNLSKTNSVQSNVSLNAKLKQGRNLRASQFPDYSKESSRGRLTMFFGTFKDGDYLTGKEFATVYLAHTRTSKLLKGTVASYIEENIDYVYRNHNSLVFHTKEEGGIHKRIKIPLVDEITVDIENGATIEFGKTFKSFEKLFANIYLLPMEFKGIAFVNGDKAFPTKGFISGDIFYYKYHDSRMAYTLK